MTDHFADALAERLARAEPAASIGPLLLTRQQVAESLQLNVRTLDRWCEEGLLPEPLRIGGSTRWLREDLESWFRNHEWQQ